MRSSRYGHGVGNMGPDQILAATCLTTSARSEAVLLRQEETGLGAEEPLSVPGFVQQIAEAHPGVEAFRARDSQGGWKAWTYTDLYDEVQTVGRALVESGLQRHHSVAILGSNSPHWVIAHLGAIFAGGIASGVHDALSAEEIARICIDCKADVIMVEQEAILKKVLLVQHKLPELKCIVQWQGEPPLSDKRRLARSHKKHILSWAGLLERGGKPPVGKDPLDERLAKVAINQCCSLVYATSNKGVMLSHDNLTWGAKMALGVIRAPGFNRTPSPGEEIMLSFLPLAHISTQLIDIYYMISVAGTLIFPATNILHNQEHFFNALKEVPMTVLYGPPLVFERLYHKLVEMRRTLSGLQKSIMDWSASQVRGRRKDFITPQTDIKLGNIQKVIVKKTVCKKYKESLGLGPKTIFICRGGSLPEGVLQFLAGFDIVVHSAYGQSESCSLLTANIPKRFCKFLSVGKPVPGVKIKLGEEGEVLAVGRNIFMGYLNRENETKEKISEDSWLRLQDQGNTDGDGFLVLTCYPADLITLFSGEEVEPSRLEDRVRMELGCVGHCLVVGQGRETLALLLSLDTEVDPVSGLPTTQLTAAAQQWFQAARFEVKTVAEVLEAVELGIQHVIQAGIDRTNLEAESASQFVKAWQILPNCFSLQTGELGQTGKVNRSVLAEKYASTINRMYTGESRRGSVTESSPLYQPYPHQLTNIVEEEERQSSRTSQDKEQVEQVEDSVKNLHEKDEDVLEETEKDCEDNTKVIGDDSKLEEDENSDAAATKRKVSRT